MTRTRPTTRRGAVVLGGLVLALTGLLPAPGAPVSSAASAAPTAAVVAPEAVGDSAAPAADHGHGLGGMLRLLNPQEARRFDRSLRELGRYLAGTTVFRVSSFNLLGHGHTAPGGDRTGWASGHVRMARAMRLLDRADVDVVGFQEFQGPQFRTFRELVGRSWAAYPGLRFGPRPVQNSVAWRTDVWALDRARTIPVPYFFGRIMRMPAVRLRNRTTGRHVWFVNVHNPANKFGAAGGWRAEATALEVGLVRRLYAGGSPVVLTGDFNDHDGAFCAIAMHAPVRSADGGSTRGGCAPPVDPAIDWIFATRGVRLSDYVRRRSALVRRTTDHPLVYASAQIPPRSR